MTASRLDVLTPTGFSGVLSHDAAYVFGYDVRAAPEAAVSLTMPVRMQPYDRATLHPIFQMNLPEGYLLERLRNLLAKSTGTDPMLLLSLLGGEAAIGRLRYRGDQPGLAAAPRDSDGETLAGILAYKGAEGLFDSLVDRYLTRSGLSGVQPKVLVPQRRVRAPDHVAHPAKAAALTEDLIVKSGLAEFPGLAINEFVCMSVAKQAGIPSPEFHLSDDRKLFVMQRFDRHADGRALGFEDMAVLSARDASSKYEGKYEDIARLIRAYCSDEHVHSGLAQLFDMVALSCLLGNGDAHLKNFGVLYDDVAGGAVRLAPAFDIANTTCYLRDDSLALMLGGNKSFFASRQTLLDFASACDMKPQQAKSRLVELAECAAAVLDEHRGLASEVAGFVDEVSTSIALFRSTFGPSQAPSGAGAATKLRLGNSD